MGGQRDPRHQGAALGERRGRGQPGIQSAVVTTEWSPSVTRDLGNVTRDPRAITMPWMAKTTEEELRPLADDERQVILRLLSEEFPGNRALAAQLSQAQARRVDTDGGLELAVTGSPAEVVRRIPVEAEVDDSDGTTIHVLLHVVNGFLNELEFFREDGAPVQGAVLPERLRPSVL